MTTLAPAGAGISSGDSLVRASALTQRAAIERREVSAGELVDAVLAEIHRVNPLVNAVVAVDEESASCQARALDRRQREGVPMGPLHGVPVTVKDTIEVDGHATTAGSKRYAAHRATREAPAIAQLRAAGAVIVGKTNVPNLAGDYQTYNGLFGLTRNPWSLDRTAGGSSGGSAVSVACGFAALDLGSDTAGSLSLPAHYCGVYAHKPSFGAVPTTGHIPPDPGSLLERDITVFGPLARHPDDLRVALAVLTGDVRMLRRPIPLARTRSLRIAVLIDEPGVPLDPNVRAVLEEAVSALQAAGFDIGLRGRPDIDPVEVQAVCCQLIAAAASGTMQLSKFEFVVDVANGFADDDCSQVALLARGTAMSHRRWLELQEWVRQYQAAWRRYFEEIDLVLCPVGPTAAFPHDIESQRETRTIKVDGSDLSYFSQLTWPSVVALAHAPATTIPAGFDPGGLPVGLQLMGPEGADARCLAAASAIDAVLGGYRTPPVVTRDRGQGRGSCGA